MKKFANLGFGMVLIVICLILGSCASEGSGSSSAQTSSILDFSKIIITHPIQNDSFFDEDVVIRAYDSYDIFGTYNSSEYSDKHTTFETEKNIRILEAQTNEELSESQLENIIAQIDAEFEANIQGLKNDWQNEKYTALSNWFAERGISSSPKWNEEKSHIVSLVLYSIDMDDLTALQNSGLHICYTVSVLDHLENH